LYYKIKGLPRKLGFFRLARYSRIFYYKIKSPLRTIKINLFLILEFKLYIKEVVSKVREISPDYIVMISDQTISYRILKRFFPESDFIIIQPCFIDLSQKNIILNTQSFKKKILNICVSGVLTPKQPYFGLENNTDKLFVYDNDTYNFYNKKISKLFKFSMYQTKANQRDSNVLFSTHKKKVLIFLTDLSTVFNIDIQNYIEKTYQFLVKKYSKDYFFIFKDHPRKPLLNFENKFDQSLIAYIHNEFSVSELIKSSDMCISTNSNASVMALYEKIPIINFIPKGCEKNMNMLSDLGAIVVNDIQQFDKYFMDYEYTVRHFESRLKTSKNFLFDSNDPGQLLLDGFNA
jgi:hypothetical protein